MLLGVVVVGGDDVVVSGEAVVAVVVVVFVKNREEGGGRLVEGWEVGGLIFLPHPSKRGLKTIGLPMAPLPGEEKRREKKERRRDKGSL